MAVVCRPLNAVALIALVGCGGGGGGADDSAAPPSTAASICTTPSTRPDNTVRPHTIPALREWRPSTGSFTPDTQSRIVIAAADQAALLPVAEVFADDLLALTGRRPPLASGVNPRAGDFSLRLSDGCDARLGDEGYGLRIAESVAIQARDARGAFYATRTVLQLMAQRNTLPAGHALDWPRYAERGLMVDFGRKYYTPAWFHAHVREIAYLKYNLLHLHFSENLGFRIESSSHPEIVSAEHLTKAEVREIIALAGRYFTTVLPELGMPSHMGAALAPHPELQLTDSFGQRNANALDVTNPAAVQFAFELLAEYLPLFPGPYWHTGADEYIALYDYLRYPQLASFAQQQYGAGANGKDAVHGFTNLVNDFVRARGKTLRMWNDDTGNGAAVTLNPNIVIEWWINFSPLGDLLLIPTPQALISAGHRVHNASWWPTYYVVGAPAYLPFPVDLPPEPNIAEAYEDWSVDQFAGPLYAPIPGEPRFPPETVAADEPGNLGTTFHVWGDQPDAETEAEVAANIAPRLRVIAQKAWESPPLVPTYAEFETIMDRVKHAPGYE